MLAGRRRDSPEPVRSVEELLSVVTLGYDVSSTRLRMTSPLAATAPGYGKCSSHQSIRAPTVRRFIAANPGAHNGAPIFPMIYSLAPAATVMWQPNRFRASLVRRCLMCTALSSPSQWPRDGRR